MLKWIAFENDNIIRRAVNYVDLRSYLLTALFIGLSLGVPQIFHQFNLAGPTFLPMHIFVLLAGLLFGWKAGAVVGFLSPLVSFAMSGMPPANILPQTVIELSTYGLVAGVLREKSKLRLMWSLMAAMAAGRVALFLVVYVLHFGRAVYSPLGNETSAVAVLGSVISQGWPGIIIQLAFIPLIAKIYQRLTPREVDEK